MIEGAAIDMYQVIQGCREHNARAQKQLYDALYDLAMNIAIRYSRDVDDAENILTSAFIKLFQNIHRFDENRGSVYAWFKTIVIHEALDFIRQRERFEGSVDMEEVLEVSVENNYAEKVANEDLLQLIQALPMPTRAVFNLYVMEGYTHEEIAQLLEMSSGNSKWHLNKARKILQQQLINLQRS